MNQWFRFYNEVKDDPKIQMLPDHLYRTWSTMLCIYNANDCQFPPVDQIAFTLRLTIEETQYRLNALLNAGLFDEKRGVLTPHNWHGRQFSSDTSRERTKKWRAKRHRDVTGAVTETPPDTDTEQIQNRTDSEQIQTYSYGEFGFAKMTADEYGKLKELLNGKTDAYIARFDGWVAEAPEAKEKGVKRKDRKAYPTIRNWYRWDGEKHEPKQRESAADRAERLNRQMRDGTL